LVFAAIYLSTWAGHYTTRDGIHKINWAKAMLDGKVHDTTSKYGIGHTLLAIPPLAAARIIQTRTGIHAEPALYTLMFVMNGALFLSLVAFYLAHFYPPHAVWKTVLILGLATIWWPYTKLDFSAPLVLTTAFLGFVVMRFGSPFWGMLIVAFTLAIRADSVAIVAPLMLWCLFTHRSVRVGFQLVAAAVPSIALVGWSDWIRYHSLFNHGYDGEQFSNPLLVGLYGILLSSGKSIFLFSPPLILGVLGWRVFAQRDRLRSDAWLFLSIAVAQLILFAKWWDWSSDDAWGVRFVIPGVLLMCIPLVAILARRKLVIPLVGAGIAIQLLAVLVGPLNFIEMFRAQTFQREALYVGGRNRVDFEDIRYDPSYNQILGSWILFRELIHLPPSPANPRDAQYIGTRLFDAAKPQVWVSAAYWDLIWNARRK